MDLRKQPERNCREIKESSNKNPNDLRFEISVIFLSRFSFLSLFSVSFSL
ncbi:hypothetical protein Hanom_Chr06g00535741 [Helianthus anomalus]